MIPLFKPFMPQLPELENILYSGELAYGKYTKLFEESLKKYFNTQYLIVTNTFSNAISVVLSVKDITPGDQIISSPMACLASTQPYLSSGLEFCWADVDAKTGTLLPESVKKKISPKTKAIIHNHYCGYPGYIDEINEIGRIYGIPVIDDGIECFGAEYKNKKIGNCGTDITVFSLGAVRLPNCIDGGIVIFKDKRDFEKSLLIRDLGINRKLFRDDRGEINPGCDISIIGYSATMSNVNGYIGLKQMEHIDELLLLQRKQADKWKGFFENQSRIVPIYRDSCMPNYWVYGVLVDNKKNAIEAFRKNGYYASGVHIRNDFYSVFGNHEIELPGVDCFYNSFVALPCGWWMNYE